MSLSTSLKAFLARDFSNISSLGIYELRHLGSSLSIPSSSRSKADLLTAISNEVAALQHLLNEISHPAPEDGTFTQPVINEPSALVSHSAVVEPGLAEQASVSPLQKRSVQEQADFIVRELETKSPQEVAILVDASETAHYSPLTKIKTRRPRIDKLLPHNPVCDEYKAAIKRLNLKETVDLNADYSRAVQSSVMAPKAVDTTLLMSHVEKLRARVTEGSHVDLRDALFVIALVTGRRLSECNDFSRFSLAGEYSLHFSGQLKKGTLPVPTFEIPTLIPAAEVLLIMEKVCNFKILKNASANLASRSAALGLPCFKSLRSIYVRFALHLVSEKHLISSAVVASKLLGHVTDSDGSSTSFRSYEQLTVQFPDHALQLRSAFTVEEIRALQEGVFPNPLPVRVSETPSQRAIPMCYNEGVRQSNHPIKPTTKRGVNIK